VLRKDLGGRRSDNDAVKSNRPGSRGGWFGGVWVSQKTKSGENLRYVASGRGETSRVRPPGPKLKKRTKSS